MAKKTSRKNPLRRYAVIGLWFAGIALLATLVMLAIKLVSLVGIYTIPNTKVFDLILWIVAGLVVVSLAAFALLDSRRVLELLTGRQAKHGSTALITTAAFIGILVVVNLITFQNPKQWDLTEDKSNSLAPETIDILTALPSQAHATAFYSTNTSTTAAEELLLKFQTNSNGNFTYEFIDPDLNPLAAQQAGITGDAKIFIQMEGRHEIIASASEQDIAESLVRLMNPGSRAVYFLTGHGEASIDSNADFSYTMAKTALEAKNYTVASLNLLAENNVPADALAIILAGPTFPLSVEEMTLLEEYVANGGSLVVMRDPVALTDVADKTDPLADYLAQTWGIVFGNDLVIDPNSNQPVYAVAYSYSTHLITSRLQGIVTFFPTDASLNTTAVADVQATILAQTTDTAWGETDFASMESGQVSFDPALDHPGPVNLAIAADQTSSGARLVVFGDADFASDTFFNQYGNGDMLINAIDWAAQQESLINLTASQPVTRQLEMPSGPVQLILVLSMLCLLPGIVIAAGVLAWIARKAKG